MLKLDESVTFKDFLNSSVEPVINLSPSNTLDSSKDTHKRFATLISYIFTARDKTHLLHLSTDSYSNHMALKELYELLLDSADKLTESYQGKNGILEIETLSSDFFTTECPIEFASILTSWLENDGRSLIGSDSFIINMYEELIANVFQIKYKLENLS